MTLLDEVTKELSATRTPLTPSGTVADVKYVQWKEFVWFDDEESAPARAVRSMLDHMRRADRVYRMEDQGACQTGLDEPINELYTNEDFGVSFQLMTSRVRNGKIRVSLSWMTV